MKQEKIYGNHLGAAPLETTSSIKHYWVRCCCTNEKAPALVVTSAHQIQIGPLQLEAIVGVKNIAVAEDAKAQS
jgi:hypothetical protein